MQSYRKRMLFPFSFAFPNVVFRAPPCTLRAPLCAKLLSLLFTSFLLSGCKGAPPAKTSRFLVGFSPLCTRLHSAGGASAAGNLLSANRQEESAPFSFSYFLSFCNEYLFFLRYHSLSVKAAPSVPSEPFFRRPALSPSAHLQKYSAYAVTSIDSIGTVRAAGMFSPHSYWPVPVFGSARFVPLSPLFRAAAPSFSRQSLCRISSFRRGSPPHSRSLLLVCPPLFLCTRRLLLHAQCS